jgi:hypothetical protein
MDKAAIIQLLQTNDKAIARALVVLNERQTAMERSAESTINDNGEGFTPADARMGTSMAEFYAKRGYLTEKQLAYWKKPNVRGVWRICKYAGQLLEIAAAKAKAAKMMEPKVPVDDVGNMSEELMVLEEQYENLRFEFNDTLDADDDRLTGSIVGKMEAVAERIALLKKEISRAYREMA